MSRPEGFFILTGGGKKDALAFHCSRCGVDYIIGNGSPARVFCCGQWKEYKPDQLSGFFGLFSSGPEPLPRVRFKEQSARRLGREDPLGA